MLPVTLIIKSALGELSQESNYGEDIFIEETTPFSRHNRVGWKSEAEVTLDTGLSWIPCRDGDREPSQFRLVCLDRVMDERAPNGRTVR